jgi:hypothetical protein
MSLRDTVSSHPVCCCLDHADSKPPSLPQHSVSSEIDRDIASASFGTNPFEWFRAAINPGLRQQRSSREIDTAKRTKAQDESQSIFDTVTSEEEKGQQPGTKPVGTTRQSDHVCESASRLPEPLMTRAAQILNSEFQNFTSETKQTRSSDLRKAYRFSHLANDV